MSVEQERYNHKGDGFTELFNSLTPFACLHSESDQMAVNLASSIA